MKDLDLKGLIPALVIAMDKDFKIDKDIFCRYLNLILDSEVKAIAINTDAGEGPLLTLEERKEILALTVEKVKRRVPIISGLTGINTCQVIKFAKELKDLGADCFLVFPHSSFNSVTKGKDRAAITYHQKIAKVGLPMIIFQLQSGLGGIEYSYETLSALVEIDQVIAIKEASFNALKFSKTVNFLSSLSKRVTILTGNDNFILESFLLGAQGALIGFGSIFTKEQVEMIEAVKRKNFDHAFSIYRQLKPICDLCFSPPVRNYRSRIKEVLVAQNIFKVNIVRPPLTSILKEEKKIILGKIPKK